MSAGTPVLRLTCPEGYELKPDDVRWSETQEWLDTHLKPLLEALPADARSFLGRDFGRSGDLSVDYPLLQEKNPVRRVPFVLELRNVPFKQQEQIARYLMDGLPNLMGAALDARGNGSYLAEYAMQRYGSSRVKQVMPTENWYREHMPPVKAALEDGNRWIYRRMKTRWMTCGPFRWSTAFPACRNSAQKRSLTVASVTGIQPSHWRWRTSPAVKLTKGR